MFPKIHVALLGELSVIRSSDFFLDFGWGELLMPDERQHAAAGRVPTPASVAPPPHSESPVVVCKSGRYCR